MTAFSKSWRSTVHHSGPRSVIVDPFLGTHYSTKVVPATGFGFFRSGSAGPDFQKGDLRSLSRSGAFITVQGRRPAHPR
jgi:hypothetical protein